MLIACTVIFSYLIGAISFSYILTKKMKKIDIRQVGSGNAGATNTQRVLGTGPALIVLALDVCKGIACLLIARLLVLPDWAVALAGLAAIAGHDFPIYYRFKGGKGVATTIGVFFMLMPFEALCAAFVTIIIIALSRYVSLGSLFFLLATPLLGLFFGSFSVGVIAIMFVIAALTYVQHRTNINRLVHGCENKIGHKKADM
ncbi:MAG: glycerol-3-phosphate 1-O-acyltransferase PlsY [Sporolactobacillus sp.]